jgi:hypothetical protein
MPNGLELCGGVAFQNVGQRRLSFIVGKLRHLGFWIDA